MKKKLPNSCPSCSSELQVSSLHCNACDTTINGLYNLPAITLLDPKEQEFILKFVINSGSLKVMAKELNLSYPTVRNMLDELINKIKNLQENDQETI